MQNFFTNTICFYKKKPFSPTNFFTKNIFFYQKLLSPENSFFLNNFFQKKITKIPFKQKLNKSFVYATFFTQKENIVATFFNKKTLVSQFKKKLF